MEMIIRPTSVKSFLWFCTLLLVTLSFPMQVYAKSPFPAILPYLLVGLIACMTLLSGRNSFSIGRVVNRNRNIDLMVRIYIFLLFLNTAWQTSFGVISINEAGSALVVYLLPLSFYWYFRSVATEGEIHWVLVAMVVSGLIVGVYFAYDSYLKLALHQVSEYSREAFQYSVSRADANIDVSESRVGIASRSFGLLETHSVSGAWVVLGSLAALAVLPRNRKALRLAVVSVFGAMLLMGLNFTAIVSFAIIMFLFEFGGILLLRGRVSVKFGGNLVALIIIVALVAGCTLWMAGDVMSAYMINNLSDQKDLALGMADSGSPSMFQRLILYLEDYLLNVFDHPLTLLIGDGFSSYGMLKGGDIGLVESMSKFGLPFFLVIVFGLLSLMKSGLIQMCAMSEQQNRVIQFSICVMLLIMITEGHYSVWAAKPILPVVFFSLAMYDRYLPSPHGTSTK